MEKNKNIEQFTKDTEKLELLSREQSLLKQSLLNTIHTQKEVEEKTFSLSPYFSHIYYFHKVAVYVVIAFLLLMPTAYATEKSLPGNPLYFVKTEVVEPFTETIAFNSETKARVVLNHAHDRLEETATLVARDHAISEDIRESSNNLKEKVADVQRHIQNINPEERKSRVELQKNLVTVLEAYVAILEQENGSQEYADIINTVDDTAEVAENDLIESIEDYSQSTDAEIVSEETSDLLEEFEEKILTASSTDSEDAVSEETTAIIQDALEEAQDELQDADIGEALETLILSDQNTEVIETIDALFDDEEIQDSDTTIESNTGTSTEARAEE